MATSSRSAGPGLLDYLPQGRWLLVGAAFLLGWLLFALVWLAGRGDDTTTPGPAKPVAEPVAFEPLPRPMAAGDAATPLPAPTEEARVVEQAPAPAPAPAPVETTPLPPSIDEAAPVAGQAMQAPSPLPEQSPSPRYPLDALRRGETGTVILQVQVDAQGQPVSIDVSQRSGSRDLDRAAVEAVSRWRFSPALDAAGNAVPGGLSVPVDFKLE
ncbi:TonB family protein [Pseudoxanthomonas daejeonensis]|uniref:energy transducer TonB n=1 Tax=Pseudoxanthomonas daejeonensis TaxID=266062 RepID=UPI001F5436EB|nr:energy transducer TonB [Pseudoxanthomonas daejeonensis]UNK57111.1 TonB family protein [Pseudoxanthomonas daejeonensis]